MSGKWSETSEKWTRMSENELKRAKLKRIILLT